MEDYIISMRSALVVYKTVTGHTVKLAGKIRRRLEDTGYDVEIINDREFEDVKEVLDYDLIAIGSPCEKGKMASEIEGKIKKMKKLDLAGKEIIVFSTCDKEEFRNSISIEIMEMLKDTGITKFAEIGYLKHSNDDMESMVNYEIKDRRTEEEIKAAEEEED